MKQALNTFIDDIFAFIIKMPMLYRIGFLRDDVIFFIFLYQVYTATIVYSKHGTVQVTGENLGWQKKTFFEKSQF